MNPLRTCEKDVEFANGGLRPPPTPSLSFWAVQACFQEHRTMNKTCVKHKAFCLQKGELRHCFILYYYVIVCYVIFGFGCITITVYETISNFILLLYCVMLYHKILHYMILYCILVFHMKLCFIVLYNIISYYIMLYHIISCYIIFYHIIPSFVYILY